jgi:hypothetical protein
VSFNCTHLPQFRGEQAGQIGDGEKSKKIDEDNCLQSLQAGMRAAVGRNYAIVVQFQHRAVKDESQGRDQLGPHPRQQHGSNDNDQRIEEVQGTVPASGLVDHQADQEQIGQDLQRGLQAVFLPEGKQQHIEQRKAVPEQDGADEQPHGQRRGSKLRHRELNGQQQRQDKNADPDQPHQPIALIKRRLHGFRS